MQNEKVFGIGFPKTATTTLEEALGKLGYKVCRGDRRNNYSNYLMALYVHRDYEELGRMIAYFDAFADLPWGGSDMYLWLAEQYPEAHFILTTRDPEEWYSSLMKVASQVDGNPVTALDSSHAAGAYGAVFFIKRVWGVETLANAKPRLLDLYERHNRAVHDYFRGQEQFLSIDLTKEPSWEPLCDFLGKEIPKLPFPHANPGHRKRPPMS